MGEKNGRVISGTIKTVEKIPRGTQLLVEVEVFVDFDVQIS